VPTADDTDSGDGVPLAGIGRQELDSLESVVWLTEGWAFMPIDFQEARIRFASDTGGPRTASHRFEFPSNVTKAATFINGFNIGFTRISGPLGTFNPGPLRQQEINTRVNEVDEEDVEVVATLALRDISGNFDNPYEGFIDVVVVVDRA
jgi:hypothetical protein